MNAEEVFLDYTEAFDNTLGKIRLKIYHTMKVAEVMDELTKRLELSDHVRELAHYTAVFHDIGRFEQVRKYDTFNDKISEDHAAIGCRVLTENNILKELSEEDQEKVLTAIKNHNQYVIEEGLDEETLTLCKLIRDADKIDILRVFATEDPVDTMGESLEQVEAEVISDDVYERIMNHQQIPKSIRKTGLDFWIGFLGFIFDLNYPESRAIIREQDHYRRRFLQAQFKNEETRERVANVLEEIGLCLEA